MEPDFSGYATKVGLKCSDGRTIMPDAFKHMDGAKVPLVWQHGHGSPENVLGHAILEHRADGVYAKAYFNETSAAQNAKLLVSHGDITALSIYANQLVERTKKVVHGMIREVSLVLSGANPGALIDNVAVQHGDGSVETIDGEAVIYTGLSFSEKPVEHADKKKDGPTVQDVYDTLDDDQKNVVHYMLDAAVKAAMANAAHSDVTSGDVASDTDAADKNEGDLAHDEKGTDATMTRNVFESSGKSDEQTTPSLTHEDVKGIFADAVRLGSMKAAVGEYALAHGIDNIDVLFPDAKAVTDRPEFDKRRTEWVASVLNGTRHTPFSRIKSLTADLTLEDARAKGYVKGNVKKEQFFSVAKRVTTPQTIYKKQKLDRDDIIDITDFDVVAWLKFEMRFMLEEELARAVLIGDGREVDDVDKIGESYIRPIATDDDLYAPTINVNLDDASSSYLEFVNAVIENRRFYKGTGTPTFYTTEIVIAKLLTLRDTNGRRYWRTLDELAAELRVESIVPVEVMEDETDLLGIMVNLQDYTIGADRGGDVSMFDDFDIDYNQYKYLIETRVSGALTKIRAALVFRKVVSTAALVVPVAPTLASNVVTPATTTGVTYKRADTDATVTTGAPITLNNTTLKTLTIYAVPASASYYLENNVQDEWTFKYKA